MDTDRIFELLIRARDLEAEAQGLRRRACRLIHQQMVADQAARQASCSPLRTFDANERR
jgi:hypothetical protein